MKNNPLIYLVLMLWLIGGCSKAQQTDDKVLAEVNGSKLTYSYLLDQFPDEYRSTISNEQISKAVEVWIETELLYQEALKKKIDQEPRVKNIVEQKRKDIIASRFVDISISDDKEISEAEIDSAYQANKSMYTTPENMYKLKHIVMSTKGGADAIYSRLQKGESFASLVGDYSEDEQSRKNGGEIGLLGESGLEPSIIGALNPLNAGDFSKPVKSQSGYYHIFLVENKIAAGTVPKLDDIRNEIVEAIKAERQQVIYNDLVDKLSKAATIKRNPINESKK
jgi:EpsD family peptidyl-prolyl cis-trans isomerase